MNRTEEIHQLKTELWSAQEERDQDRDPASERDVGGTGPQAGDEQSSRRLTPLPRAASAASNQERSS